MFVTEVSLVSVFLAGLLGGVHCALMCGPIMSVMQMTSAHNRQSIRIFSDQRARATPTVRLDGFRRALAYNLGRIAMYTFMGAMAGGLGASVWLLPAWLPVQQFVLVVTSAAFILLGLHLTGVKVVVNAIEAAGRVFWRPVQPLASAQLGRRGSVNAFLAGGLWGLLPCGMVYSVIALALVSGSAWEGAVLMLAFGLGTLPNLMLIATASSTFGSPLTMAGNAQWLGRAVGVSVLGFGFFLLMRLSIDGHMAH